MFNLSIYTFKVNSENNVKNKNRQLIVSENSVKSVLKYSKTKYNGRISNFLYIHACSRYTFSSYQLEKQL